MKENQLTYNNEILDEKLADRSLTSKDDIARKNVLIFIAKNLNKTKSVEEIKKNIEEHMGAKNAVNFFFKRDDNNDKHLGSCNIQCLNGMDYKKFGKKMVKFFGKYVKYTLHPRSLGGANAPSVLELIRLEFNDVNNALASTIETFENILAKKTCMKT